MNIKNTEELVKSAEAHKKADHIANGRYLDVRGKKNGVREEHIQLCAIGCLASPVTMEEIAEVFPKSVKIRTTVEENGEVYTHYDARIGDWTLTHRLKNHYGITNQLAYAAEMFFEGEYRSDDGRYDYEDCNNHIMTFEERQNWPLEFAKALNEGAFIDNDMVCDYFDNNGLVFGVSEQFEPGDQNDFLEWLKSIKADN